MHEGAIIEKDFDDYQFHPEGGAEEDAEGVGFVCRRVAKDHHISPFRTSNRFNCVVLVGNLITFLGMVLWLNKYH